jgi:hypothetical protein
MCGGASGGSALGRVGDFGHALGVIGAVGFLAEGGVGVLVLEGFCSLFVASAMFAVVV